MRVTHKVTKCYSFQDILPSSGTSVCSKVPNRQRRIRSIPQEVYAHLIQILQGHESVVTRKRTKVIKRAYYYYYAFQDSLSARVIEHPVTGSVETRIMYEDLTTNQELIVLQTEEKSACIDFYYKRAKGESARKIKKRMDVVFASVTEREIQVYINNSRLNQRVKGRFENKAPLKPVTAKRIWERIQIDLISMSDLPVDIDKKKYQWILSIVDVFSHYLVLKPLHSKDTAVISEQLLQVFADFGTPSIIQCDRGSEFMGCVERVAKVLQVKIIHSVRNPQSQGKV